MVFYRKKHDPNDPAHNVDRIRRHHPSLRQKNRVLFRGLLGLAALLGLIPYVVNFEIMNRFPRVEVLKPFPTSQEIAKFNRMKETPIDPLHKKNKYYEVQKE
jgi:Tfp pilus assembly protein PilN